MAMQSQFSDKWQEIRAIHRQYGLFYKALLIGLGVLIGAVLFGDAGYISNLWTESLSVALTILVLNALAEQREEGRRENELLDWLIRDVRSSVNDVSRRAVEELRSRGWLTGDSGVLRGLFLIGANLGDANLFDANLQGVMLMSANLENSILYMADLRWAQLTRTNLHSAWLEIADMREAGLTDTYFKSANLHDADVRGADFTGANLEQAYLEGTKFDESTLLPDGTRWTPGTDLTRFTDPNHPKFWRSDDPQSPAYRGK